MKTTVTSGVPRRKHPSGVKYLFGKHATEKKIEIAYESNPPSCRNCYSLQKIFHGREWEPARPDYCLKHELLLKHSRGICDRGESPKGETLEDNQGD